MSKKDAEAAGAVSPGTGLIRRPARRRPRRGTAEELIHGLDDAPAAMRIGDLAAAMDRDPGLMTVGVVDGGSRPLGLVVRRELFDMLGKPFGRDLLAKKPLSSIAAAVRAFPADSNVFSLAEALREDLRAATEGHFLLTAADGTFAGTFTSRDLLRHLSGITERDLALARRLQSGIVKGDFDGSTEGYGLHCVSRMAKEVGGDFYAVRRLEGDRVFLCVCDVSGKGVAASLITSVIGGMLDAYDTDKDLPSFLVRLNRYILSTFQMEFFVTGVFLEYEPSTGRALLCDMGHSYLLAMEGNRLLRVPAGSGGLPLGVDEHLVPETASIRLKQGAQLFLFTDGVIEQSDPAGEEFSEKRLWAVLRAHACRQPRELCGAVLDAVSRFRGAEPQRDDLTFLALRRP